MTGHDHDGYVPDLHRGMFSRMLKLGAVGVIEFPVHGDLSLGPFPDSDTPGNQRLLEGLIAQFPEVFSGAAYIPGSQKDCDGWIDVRSEPVFAEFAHPQGAADEWWWCRVGDTVRIPVEMGTHTPGAFILHMATGRGILRWPYGLSPRLLFWRCAMLNPLRYDGLLNL